MKRRNFITSTLMLASGLSISGLSSKSFASTNVVNASSKKKKLRIAHITDMHIMPGDVPKKGIENLISSLNGLKDKPDFVLNTGDNVMDSLAHSKEATLKQWDSWNEYFRSNLKFPLRNCLGNHDIWGWSLKDSSVKDDPEYGKTLGLKMLGLEKSYYSFDAGNWRFIILDSLTYKEGGGYIGKLGDEQMNWLSEELQNTPAGKHVCLASHIPIVSISAIFGSGHDDENWNITVSTILKDAKEVKDILYQHKNVKAALSGHLHMCDKSEYLGTTYACDGAVSGGWWKGKNREFGPGYALVDFYEDGTFDCNMVFI